MLGETQLLREHVQRWKVLGPELDRIRLAGLAALTTPKAAAELASAFALAAALGTRPTSGLVEQQDIFKRLHPR